MSTFEERLKQNMKFYVSHAETPMSKWTSKSAQAEVGKRGARITMKKYQHTLDWLGGEDCK